MASNNQPARDDDPELWHLTFRPEPGSNVPARHRVRSMLKAALRRFGLRCVSVNAQQHPPGETPPR